MTPADHEAAQSPTSICLIHIGAIGDFILALRVVASLQAQWPGARIEVLGHPATASLASGRGGVDAVTSWERLPSHTMFAEDGQPDDACLAYFRPFGVIVNMATAADAAFARHLVDLGTARVVTLDPNPRGPKRHVTESWLDDLRAAGIAASPDPPTLVFDDDERREGRQRLRAHTGSDDRPIVLLHPGSGGRDKCWPVEEFCRLADTLRAADAQPVFNLGPVEQDLHGQALADRLTKVAPVLCEPRLSQAAATVATADAYVGNDAGMTHVAAAARTPTVVLFGPTDPVVWQPLGQRVIVIAGQPSGTFGEITPERVAQTALKAIQT